MKPFYITLPSGGRGNKTSSFTVNLPYEVDLHGKWEVALVDVIYPTSWHNVYEGNRGVKLYRAPPHGDLADDKEYQLTVDYYDNVDAILDHWVAIYFPQQGLPEFFDSFARAAFAPELRQLLGNVYLHNRAVRQSPPSDTCGQHVVYYARERARGLPFNSIYYTETLAGNDILAKEYLKRSV